MTSNCALEGFVYIIGMMFYILEMMFYRLQVAHDSAGHMCGLRISLGKLIIMRVTYLSTQLCYEHSALLPCAVHVYWPDNYPACP